MRDTEVNVMSYWSLGKDDRGDVKKADNYIWSRFNITIKYTDKKILEMIFNTYIRPSLASLLK